MKETRTDYDFSLLEVLKFVLKWKWHIVIITLLAAVAGAVFSGPQFITPKFESTVIFYPTTNNSISNAILSDNTLRDKDVLEFGEESEAEYALQMLSSASLMGKVVERFDLMRHYGIDPNAAYPQSKLDRQIRKNFNFRRTELLSIEIKVKDKDPQMAADIANYISAQLDTTKTMIQRQVAAKTFQIIEQEYLAKIREVEDLQATINQMSKGQQVDADLVTNPFSRKNKKAARQDALQNSDKLMSGGNNLGTLLSLTESLSLEVEQLNELKKKFERAKVDMEEFIPHHFIISPAAPAEQKSTPIRSLIVLISAASAFAMSIVFILVYEKVRVSLRELKTQAQ